MANDSETTEEPALLSGLIASGTSSITRRRHSQDSLSGARRRVARTLLTLAVVFLSAAVTLPSAQAQTYTVLHTFKGGADGANPYAGLTRDAAGNLYGTTVEGGDLSCPDDVNGCGTVFKLDSSGALTTLHAFAGGAADGANPYAVLIRDAAGNLYGTTAGGGDRRCIQGCGTVFKLDAAGSETVLYRFTGGADGDAPEVGVRDAAGNLFGATWFGGKFIRCTRGCGTVFKLDASGNLTTLYAFHGPDGEFPFGPLTRDAAGDLYGTTQLGGFYHHGNVFKLDPAGVETILYTFGISELDGEVPQGSLIRDAAGNLYGTTLGGGPHFGGTVFRLRANGQITYLHTFPEDEDGQGPFHVMRGTARNLYGTTMGGELGSSVVFGLNVESLVETVVHTFKGGAEGSLPSGTLIQDAAGNLYGTTNSGGDLTCNPPYGCGVVFKIKLP